MHYRLVIHFSERGLIQLAAQWRIIATEFESRLRNYY
jgi:hypothetical protein